MEIAFGMCAVVLALYLPGYPFFRGMRFSRIASIIAAPLFSGAAYGVLPIVYYRIGISCNVLSTFGVALIVGIACYFISRKVRRREVAIVGMPAPKGVWFDPGKRNDLPLDYALLLLYVACGIIVCTFVFGMNLASADVPYIRYDNQTHLSVTKAFVDSGMWSTLHPNRYLALPVDARALVSGGISFYPSLLYVFSALCAGMTGLSATASFNATLFALCAVVYPAGMFGILRVVFRDNRGAVAIGAIVTMCFAGFPWGIYVRALFPNVAGYCVMTPALAAIMLLLEARPLKQALPALAATGVLGVITMGIAHPNAVFTAFLVMTAYIAHRAGAYGAATSQSPDRKLTRRIAYTAAVIAVALVLWIIAFNLPFLHSVVSYFGNSIMKPIHPLRKLAFMSFDPFSRQYFQAFICLAGILACIRYRKLWILFPVAWFVAAYFIIRTQNTFITHFIAGFWYTDHVRIAGALCICFVPVATLGLQACVRVLVLVLKRIVHSLPDIAVVSTWVVSILLFACLNFMPNFSMPIPDHDGLRHTGFGSVYSYMEDMYSWSDKHVYAGDEHEFAREVKEIVGDALVINYPADGSIFAYPTDDLKVYYRSFKLKHQTSDAQYLRKHLKDYATDKRIQQIVELIDAQYVVEFDHGVSYEDGKWFRQFKNPGNWQGITKLTDSTPGFEVVLARDDLRLYRIVR